MIAGAGSGALLAKADIKSAFRLIPIHPDDFCLLGIKVSDKIFVDKTLPMGASCAPAHFESFSTFLEWVVSTRVGTGHVCHYVDDFLFISGALRGAVNPVRACSIASLICAQSLGCL